MHFTLSRELTREIFIRDRIPAIRFLRDYLQPIGFVPGLGTCKAIVEQIQAGQAKASTFNPETFLVTVK